MHGVELSNVQAQPVDGKWTVSYNYALTGGHQPHGEEDSDTDDSLTGQFDISVKDATGDTATGTISVAVHDDVPVLVADNDSVTEGTEVTASGNVADNDLSGADGFGHVEWKGLADGSEYTLVDNKVMLDGQQVGTLTLAENGNYTFTLESNYDVPQEGLPDLVLNYRGFDTDGDSANSTLTITISGDSRTPEVTVETPEGSEADIVVDEGSQPEHGGEVHHGQSGSGSFIVDLHGEDGTITVGGFTIAIENGVATTSGSAQGVYGVTLSNVQAELVNGKWTVNYVYELSGRQEHGADGTATDESLTGNLPITVTDATGGKATGSISVTVHDDEPSISVSDMSSTVVPGSGAGNLADGEKASFTDAAMAGQQIVQGSQLGGWDGVTMYAGKVIYTQDAVGNTVIAENGLDISANYSLKYSTYAITPGKPASDWGLMVSSPDDAQAWEINVSKDGQTSEAVIFDLDGQLAYGVTIDFGAFYNGKPGAEGTTQWDHVSEKALVTFYRDGEIVGSTIVEGNSSTGTFTLNSSDVVLGGFDKVVISAVDNRTAEYMDEHSDFTIQGIDFITKRDDPFIVSEGKVTAASGADGFADAYTDIHARFDLAGMVNEGTLSADGTSGIITVLVDGQQTDVTLTLREGASGDSILTGTLESGEQLFTATLGKDGNWSMEQYEDFRVTDGTGEGSNQFELVFKTEDADGDVDSTTVNVPLEVVDQTPATDTSIGNGDDTITITGGEGIAGTVAAGDSGGMTEGQQLEANYNVCFILDMSTSMTKNHIGGSGSDSGLNRLQAAELSIQNFIGSIAGNTEFTDGSVTVAVIPFAEKAANPIEITITKESGGTTYSYNNHTYTSFDSVSNQLVDAINKANVDDKFVTDYGPAFSEAANWYNQLDDRVESATGNITYFLTDGRPAGFGTDYADKDDYERAWEGYQKLLAAQGDGHIDIHAIGFGKDLLDTDMENLAMFDNTAQAVGDAHVANGYFEASNGIYTPVTYEHPESIDRSATYYVETQGGLQEVTYSSSRGEWGYRSGWFSWTQVNEGSLLEQVIVPVTGGTSQQVTDTGSLTAAFTSGFNPGALVAAGDDTITAAESDSSVIIYGDVMNTDRLRYELVQNEAIAFALVAAGIDYGSGSEVFQWLEGNGDRLTGDYAGWTHDDTLKYMLEHAEELGYETRVDGNGEFYLVTADGTVLNMDGTEANVGLDSLTGRGGGNDTIIGSQADDVIYGQEGNDLLVGDAPSESGEGSTVGSIEGTTVASIKAMDTDGLDAFIQSVEGTDADGDDRLFGGTGDDVLLGMGGDDYIDGGAGEDAIFGGSGNDIIVYDSNDYLVSGGSGIDFMVSDNSTLTLTELLSGGKDGKDGPIVDSIEVLLKGDAALSLTSIQELADKYGITLGTNDAGQETLTLDMSKWTAQQDGSYDFKGDADLTLETNLQQDSGASSDSDGEMAQQVFILQNSNS